MANRKAAAKELTIVRRYEFKNGRVVSFVNSKKVVKGQPVVSEYQVIRYNDLDGQVTCDCDAWGHCCHMDIEAAAEMRRCDHIEASRNKPSRVTPVVIEKEAIMIEEHEGVTIISGTVEENKARLDELNAAVQAKARQELQLRANGAQPDHRPLPSWMMRGGNSRNGTFSGRADDDKKAS